MTKVQFLDLLHKKLSTLPESDLNESLGFYAEMIDDLIEEGLDEEQAVARVGSVDAIASQILEQAREHQDTKDGEEADFKSEMSSESKDDKSTRQPKARRGLYTWEIVLLVLGAPIWFSLLVAFFSIAIALYTVLLSAVICLWAAFVTLCACGIAGIGGGVAVICSGRVALGMALIAAALVCAGFAILFFFAAVWAVRGVVWLTKKAVVSTVNLIKKQVFGKEAA